MAIDIGNSLAACGLFRGAGLARHWSIDHGCGMSPAALWRTLREGAGGRRSVDGACIASVVPGMDRTFRGAVRSAFDVEVFSATPETIGMPIKGYDREQVGADRLLAAVAAYERYGRALIVIDAGTAITIDYVTARGEFAGGAIAPGMDASARMLRDITAQLPYVKPQPAKRAIAKNTEEAIRAGLHFGHAGMVENIVRQIAKEARARPLVVATGGDAKWIARTCPSVKHVHPHLVLEGLRIAWERNS